MLRKTPRSTRLILALVLICGLAAATPGLAAEPIFVGLLAADQSVYWDGGYVGGSPWHSLPLAPSNQAIDRCATVGPCFSYKLTTTTPGAVLRIALDTPMRDDGLEIVITSPTGTVTRRQNSNQYSNEALIGNPPVGNWSITVAPYSAEYASFRMRAKLESVPYQPAGTGQLLPNLRVTRLWEFGYVAPANPGNGLFPPDDANPPLDVAGVHPLSCSVDESLDEGSKRCLRYSFGLANVGDGNFDVRYSGNRSGATFPMTQCIQRTDGPPTRRPAGDGVYHATHGHFHYNDIIFHELLQVTDRTAGTLVPAGGGRKLGYSPADQAIAQWDRFVQAPAGSSGGAGNCEPGTDSRLGMSRGWGDAYRYQRPGNYVEFGTNGDGFYVVRTKADPSDVVLESDESDNTSYAYLRIVGEDVNVLESGIGSSPWDPNKVIYP